MFLIRELAELLNKLHSNSQREVLANRLPAIMTPIGYKENLIEKLELKRESDNNSICSYFRRILNPFNLH